MQAPQRIETRRLLLRRPTTADAAAIFSRYASDRDVTRYMGWPRHESVEQTIGFLSFSDQEWTRWPAGPYVIEPLSSPGYILGSTGLAYDNADAAATGYVLARDAWGQGYATEALLAVVALSRELNLPRLYALCHPDNHASIRVLEKGGFALERVLESGFQFPNLPVTPQSCLVYSRS